MFSCRKACTELKSGSPRDNRTLQCSALLFTIAQTQDNLSRKMAGFKPWDRFKRIVFSHKKKMVLEFLNV